MTRVPERPLPFSGAFRKNSRLPPFEVSAETPAGPSSGKCHLSRKPARRSSPRKPLSTRLRNRPFDLSFGTCHVSRRASRKLPRKPFEAAPRDLPDLPSEHATCFRVPSENLSSGSRPNLPSVPECLNIKLPPGALRAATRPGAHAETLSGRLPGHPPSVFRTRQVFPSAPSGKSLRKPLELATR